MITSIFNKTRPLNYLILGILLLVSFILYYFSNNLFNEGLKSVGFSILYFIVLGLSMILVNFITLKNTLTKNTNFSVLFFFIFLLFFPKNFQDGEILISNFFLLLALRRLISLKSMVSTKEKIFDASFWIFVAALFHFWSILYIILVFVSIILHVSRDFKNWLIPFVAMFSVFVLFSAVNLFLNNAPLNHLQNEALFSLDFTYFENIYQNIALAVFASIALLFFINMLFSINSKALNLQSSYKKIVFSFILGIAIYMFSANKNNACLIFSLTPLAIMGANFIENLDNKILKEVVLDVILVFGLFFFTMSL